MRDPTFHVHTRLPGAPWFILVPAPHPAWGLQEDGLPLFSGPRGPNARITEIRSSSGSRGEISTR